LADVVLLKEVMKPWMGQTDSAMMHRFENLDASGEQSYDIQ